MLVLIGLDETWKRQQIVGENTESEGKVREINCTGQASSFINLLSFLVSFDR